MTIFKSRHFKSRKLLLEENFVAEFDKIIK